MTYWYVSYAKRHIEYFIPYETLQKYAGSPKTLDPRDLNGPSYHYDFHFTVIKDEHPLVWASKHSHIAIIGFWEITEDLAREITGPPSGIRT